MPPVSPVTVTLWLVDFVVSSVVELDRLDDDVPYLTCEVDASSVVQVMVAVVSLAEAETLERTGPVVSDFPAASVVKLPVSADAEFPAASLEVTL